MLHHGIGINFSYRAELVFEFVLILEFEFLLPEQAAGDVAEGAQPALLLSGLVFKFKFVFELTRAGQLVFEFAQALKFQFIFEFVSGPAGLT
jgi:hypothetical protein